MRIRGVLVAVMLIGVLFVSSSLMAANRDTDKYIKTVAEPILDNIFEGFRIDDYSKYAKDFSPSLKLPGAATKFYKTNREVQNLLGNYQTRQHMGILRKGEIIVVLWKGMFDKTNDDVLIKLMLSKKHNKYIVTGLWLQ
ncbi:MAG: hypothetical protein GY853_10270 [PVC group bacterium]|nr:hypothetical protein [PVC group bacterium]